MGTTSIGTVGPVRLLHTSDWHLGKVFKGTSLLEEQAAALDRIIDIADEARVDAVVIAGDLYDRALPPVGAVELFDDAVYRLRATGARVIAISGNHDSPSRVGFGDRLLEQAGVVVRGAAARAAEPVAVPTRDGDGTAWVYPVPYLEPALVRHLLDGDGGQEDQPVRGPDADAAGVAGTGDGPRRRIGHREALGWALARARAHRAGVDGPTVVVAHAFVTGGATPPETCDSERDLSIGGSAAVDAALFDGFDYVALGHLHGRQALCGGRLAYSGTPLPYSFSEQHHHKSVRVVEVGTGGVLVAEQVDLGVGRRLRTLTGDLEDLLVDPTLDAAVHCRVRVVLTDDLLPRDAMARVRQRFPHAAELTHEPTTAAASTPAAARHVDRLTPTALLEQFLAERWAVDPLDDATRARCAEIATAAHLDRAVAP